MSWPGHIKRAGELRSQFSHVNDIVPTIYDIAGIQPPAMVNGVPQTPLEGVSLSYTFDDPGARGRHETQYFEMLGSRGIYKDGWWAGSFNHLPWPTGTVYPPVQSEPKPWELYHLDEDYSQAHNLAAKNPEKLKELQDLFDFEAKRNNVYPLEPRRNALPLVTNGVKSFVFNAGRQRIAAYSAPRLPGRAHTITAELDVPATGASGVIVAQGGRYSGFTLYVKNGALVYESNLSTHRVARLAASEPLPTGKVRVGVEFTPDNQPTPDTASTSPTAQVPVPGQVTVTINGKPVGSTHLLGVGPNSDTFDIGQDRGSPVSSAYTSPYAFTGTIRTVRIDLK